MLAPGTLDASTLDPAPFPFMRGQGTPFFCSGIRGPHQPV